MPGDLVPDIAELDHRLLHGHALGIADPLGVVQDVGDGPLRYTGALGNVLRRRSPRLMTIHVAGPRVLISVTLDTIQ
jgi:hypothetical protein